MTDANKTDVFKEVVLPSGIQAVFFRRKGRALLNAQRKAEGDASRISFALLSEVVEINGKPCLMEDFEEMDLFDVMRLTEEMGEMGKSGRTAKP